MRKDRVAPNTVTYNSLLSACAQGGSAPPVECYMACRACVRHKSNQLGSLARCQGRRLQVTSQVPSFPKPD